MFLYYNEELYKKLFSDEILNLIQCILNNIDRELVVKWFSTLSSILFVSIRDLGTDDATENTDEDEMDMADNIVEVHRGVVIEAF